MLEVSLLSDVIVTVPVLNLACVHHDVVVGGNVGGDAQTLVEVLPVLLLVRLAAGLHQVFEYHLVLDRSTNNSRQL